MITSDKTTMSHGHAKEGACTPGRHLREAGRVEAEEDAQHQARAPQRLDHLLAAGRRLPGRPLQLLGDPLRAAPVPMAPLPASTQLCNEPRPMPLRPVGVLPACTCPEVSCLAFCSRGINCLLRPVQVAAALKAPVRMHAWPGITPS